ncbi:MAG: sodium:alanine symporter family protein [Clostridia bacterium]|nr:sodium:alanine symporter family protein [Clostridia bacterium]
MLSWMLTGGGVLFFLLLVGIFFLFYLKGLPLRRPGRLLKILTEKQEDGTSPAKATFLALAGTLGVGNLVGVANAIAVGGPGAIFWMWVSAFFAMILKYAEILLSVRHRREWECGFFGGAAYYMKDCFERRGHGCLARLYPAIFSCFLLLNSFSMGSMIQVDAIATSAKSAFHLPPLVCALLLVLLVIPLAAKGTKEISALTSYLVPIMSLGLVVLSVFLLILRKEYLGDAIRSIFLSAFSKESFAGGLLGFLTSRALRVGTMRGLLSNEAGCGTSPTAHATSSAIFPAKQGVWGIFEVFVDTILLCSLSALVIITSGVDLSNSDGMALTLLAYSSVLGQGASIFLAVAVFVFGYATLLCWAGYGLESVRFLTTKKGWKALYLALFALSILCGAAFLPRYIWEVSDFAIAGLTLLNLTVLFLLRREVKEETLRVF